MKFIEKLISRLESSGSALCVGLDTNYDRLPQKLKEGRNVSSSIFEFNSEVVSRTQKVAAAYKMNLSFYAGFGIEGLEGLRRTNEVIREKFPSIPIIADAKRSEMGETVTMVKREIFEHLLFDAVMVTPWFGFDTVRDYLSDEKCGVIVYVHDSNPSAPEFQDLMVQDPASSRALPLYEYVTERVARKWNTNGNVMVEAGLTYPKTLHAIRKIAGEDMPLLAAGLGAQGGAVENLRGLFGKNQCRLLVNVSRGIIRAGESSADPYQEIEKAARMFASEIANQKSA